MDIGKAYSDSVAALKKYPGPLIICYFLGNAINGFVGGLAYGNFLAGFTEATLKAFRDEEPKIDDVFRGMDEFADKLIAGLIVMSGALACGIGVLVTGLIFMYAPIIVQAKGVDWKTACTESKELVMANLGPAITLMLAITGINIVGALACGIGVLLTAPLGFMMMIRSYQQLTDEA